MNELKKYFYENLYILNDKNIENYDSIEFIEKEIDLKGVCMSCDEAIPCKLMSGYSSSDDLIKIWNRILTIDTLSDFKERRIENPRVMFILENPGQNWFGNIQNSDKIKKIVSYNSLNYWFSKEEDLKNKDVSKFPDKKSSLYAFAFSHLIYKFGFGNIHITNSVKCKPLAKDNMNKFPENNKKCMLKFLKIEIQYFKPDIILCFGNNAYNNLNLLIKSDKDVNELLKNLIPKKLLHPSVRGRALKLYKERYKVLTLFDVLKKNWYRNIEDALVQKNNI